MAKLNNEQIASELQQKGCKLIDASGYTNLQSSIMVECAHGHRFNTTLADVRKISFSCPQCDHIAFQNPTAVPPKSGYRVIAFDQATEHFGLSIFDNGQLVFFHLYTFKGVVNSRILQIKNFVEMIIREGQPDIIVMEDIQYQPRSGIMTFKILAMLLGVIQTICEERQIPYEAVSPNVGRKYAGTCGKSRLEEKQLSVATVQEKYNIHVNDDVAEAILIGRYGTKIHAPSTNSFGRLK